MGPKRGPNRSIDAEGVRKPLEWLLERSWRLPEPKNISLEASWSRLGALKIASKWPDGVRGEVKGRSSEHLWPAMAPGEPIIKDYRLITTTNTSFMEDLNTPWAKGPANFKQYGLGRDSRA